MSAYKWVHNTAQYENGLFKKSVPAQCQHAAASDWSETFQLFCTAAILLRKCATTTVFICRSGTGHNFAFVAFFLFFQAWPVRPGTLGATGSY